MMMADPHAPGRAQRVVMLAALATVTLLAWIWLMRSAASPHHLHMAMSPGHSHHPFDLWMFASTVAMWQAMMVAMMTPTVVRWVFAFAALTGRGTLWRTAGFAAGYFAVWLAYSLAAASVQIALQRGGLLGMGGRLPASAGGAVLIAAGLLYFTPFSRACLRHCRNPLTYFLARWDNAPPSGFRIGLTHGAYCVGCCWAAMVTGFAMGVMNLLWMALLTVLMCVEKLAPRGDRIGAVASAAMVVWGVALFW